MKRVDTNGDFEIDFLEFCGLARVNDELELVLRSQKLECILASLFPSGTKLEDIGKMGHTQFSDIVNLSQPAMVQLLVNLAAQVAAVGTAQDARAAASSAASSRAEPLTTSSRASRACVASPTPTSRRASLQNAPTPCFPHPLLCEELPSPKP